jgi:hypothetical protein
MKNIVLLDSAAARPGKILPSERHIFPGTAPDLLHAHHRPSSSPGQSDTTARTVRKDVFMLYMIKGKQVW